jgi:hypothetical protein
MESLGKKILAGALSFFALLEIRLPQASRSWPD